MKQFQLRFLDKDKCGSFSYFKINNDTDDYKALAVETANNELQKDKDRRERMEPFYTYRPIKTVSVVEYKDGKAVRGGIKFKLRLKFIEYKYSSGRTVREEWYVAD